MLSCAGIYSERWHGFWVLKLTCHAANCSTVYCSSAIDYTIVHAVNKREYFASFEGVVNNLELKGSLKTIRKEIVIDNSIVCLDFNTYNNNEDYEIECESSSMEKAKQIINTLLNKYGISYIPSKYSKVARALKNH